MAEGVQGTASSQEMLFTYRGTLYPKLRCSPEKFQALQDYLVRRDDMMLVAYPKCGTNLCIQILNDLAAIVAGAEEVKILHTILEFGADDKYKIMEAHPSPRVYASHLHYDDLPKSIFQNGTKKLVIFRNPKDAAVSSFHFHCKSPALPTYSDWNEFFQDFLNGNVVWGSYFEHAVAWNKHIDEENVMIITYEDQTKDLAGGIQKIAKFFGFSLSEKQIQHIVNRATFEAMKSRSPETHNDLAQAHFRKGVVGDWKNYFTEAQNREMDAKFEECLAGTKLGKKLKYDVYCKA